MKNKEINNRKRRYLSRLLMMILIVFFSMANSKVYSESLNYNGNDNRIRYTIRYILNGGTPGVSSPDEGTYDSVVNISNPTKRGYEFKGWMLVNGNENTAKYGTSIDSVENLWNPTTKYVTSEYFKNLTNQNNGIVLLVANWELVDSNEDVILFNENMLKATTVTTLQQIGHPISDSNLQSINLGTPDTTIPAGDSNKIQMSNGSSYTATWDNVPYGNQNLKVKLTVKCITGKGKSYIYKDGNLIRVKWTDGSTNDEKTVRYTINFYKAGTNTAYSPTLWIGIVDPDESHYVFNTSGRTYYYKTAAESSDTVSWAQGQFTWPEVWDVQSSQFFYRYFGEQYDNPILAISNNTSSFTFDTVTPYNGFIKLVYLYLVTYDINFNGNGNTGGSMSNMTNLNYDQAYTLTQNAYTKTGYNFSGWNTKANGTGTSYSNGQSVTNLVNSDGSAVTLYAKWSEKTATLSYNANGHGTAPSSVTMKYTTATNAAGAITGITGYTFAGWNTKADGTGTSYAAGAQVKAANVVPTSTTLYAQWIPNTATITLKMNGGDLSDSGIHVELYQGNTRKYEYSNANVSGATVSWSGIEAGTYDIWAAKEWGEATTLVDTGIDIVVDGQNSAIVNYYTLTLYRGTGISDVWRMDAYLPGVSVTIDAVVKPGYTWWHWTDCSCGENMCYCNPCDCQIITTDQEYTFTMPYEELTRTAEATLNTYTIDYDLDGGSVSGTNPTSYTVEDNAITLINPTKQGYRFTGWTGTGLSGNTMTVTIPHGSTGDRSYVAHWVQSTAILTVRLDGADIRNSGAIVELRQNGSVIYPYSEAGTQGQYIGWLDVAEGTYDVYASKSHLEYTTVADTGRDIVMPNQNTNYIDYYTVTVIRGTGIESVTGGDVYLDLQNVTIDATVKPGYTWRGWTNCDCGENNCFCDPCMCELITTEKQHTFQLSGGRITRTAEATLNTYTIDYDLDGGTVSGTNPTSYTVEDDAITLINPTKPGYTFTGWTGTGLSGNTMSVTIPAGSIGNRSYVAHWTSNAVEITIKKDNVNWNANSGIKVELRQSGTTKYSATASSSSVSWSPVEAGTYDIYASKSASSLNTLVDTGLDVVVTSSGTATIDFYTLTLQAGVGISAVSGGGTYLKNQTANIDATVANGYTWQGWSVISGDSPD